VKAWPHNWQQTAKVLPFLIHASGGEIHHIRARIHPRIQR
jgi:hypothetical protein